MTLFSGVLDQERGPPSGGNGDGVLWPSDTAWGLPLSEVTAQFAGRLSGFDMNVTMPVRMAVAGRKRDGIALRLAAADERTDSSLRRLRDRLADLLALRAAGHATYEFHLSLAYVVLNLSEDQKRKVEATVDRFLPLMHDAFEIGPPAFCVFDNMSEFRPSVVMKSSNAM
ncbi:RNA ligase/cyclic nucleotide phosphodiesterase [Zopfochytrium polystomum]|nr:RNA ligase/cyclic nucleotide phosphodiesterase [Zopfochytrium polystomum]